MAGNNAIECKYENVHVFIKYTLPYSYNGVRTIVHEENCPPIRVRVRIRVGRNFPRGGSYHRNILQYMLQYEIYSSVASEKLNNAIHNTAQNCTVKYTIKLLKNPFTSPICILY